MTLFKLTKKQIIVRLILLVALLIGGFVWLCIRACPEWNDHLILPTDFNVTAGQNGVEDGRNQVEAIAPPEGYQRVPADENSFLHFMRNVPIFPKGSCIMTYDRKPVSNANAAAVYTIGLPESDYQQCADTIIRLWSAYFYSTGQFDRAAFAYSNGYETKYTDWRRGYRYVTVPVIDKTFRLRLAKEDDSEQAFYNYLESVMRYAGTLSLEAESHPISAQEAHAGDIICHGGAPGHAVVIVDEAQNADGQRCFLLAQGFMPSQSAHIIAGFNSAPTPWYTEEQLSEDIIRLSTWSFHSGDLRRWKDGFA